MSVSCITGERYSIHMGVKVSCTHHFILMHEHQLIARTHFQHEALIHIHIQYALCTNILYGLAGIAQASHTTLFLKIYKSFTLAFVKGPP